MNTKRSAMLNLFLPPQSLKSHPLLVHQYRGRLELRDAPVLFQHTKNNGKNGKSYRCYRDALRVEISWRREHPKFKWIFNTFQDKSSRPCFLAIWCNISPTQGFRCSSFSLSQLMCYTHSQNASLFPEIPSDCSSEYSEFVDLIDSIWSGVWTVWSERKQWWSGWLKRQATRRRRGGGGGGGCRLSLRLREVTRASTGLNVVPNLSAIRSAHHDTHHTVDWSWYNIVIAKNAKKIMIHHLYLDSSEWDDQLKPPTWIDLNRKQYALSRSRLFLTCDVAKF